MTKDTLAYTLPSGVLLYTNSNTALLQDYALNTADLYLRVFLAVHPDGLREYLLVEGTTPIFASQSFEGVAAHIDILALSRKEEKA